MLHNSGLTSQDRPLADWGIAHQQTFVAAIKHLLLAEQESDAFKLLSLLLGIGTVQPLPGHRTPESYPPAAEALALFPAESRESLLVDFWRMIETQNSARGYDALTHIVSALAEKLEEASRAHPVPKYACALQLAGHGLQRVATNILTYAQPVEPSRPRQLSSLLGRKAVSSSEQMPAGQPAMSPSRR